jgi:hypothetical protein
MIPLKLKRFKICFIVVCLALATITCFTVKSFYNTNSLIIQTRTVAITDNDVDYQHILDGFEDAELVIEDNKADFVGYKTLDSSLFSDLDLVSIGVTEEPENDFFDVRYQISVDAVDGGIILSAILDRGIGEPIIDYLPGLTVEDEQGNVDVLFVIDDQPIYLSDMVKSDSVDNVGIFGEWVKTVVRVVITTVAPVVTRVITYLSKSVLGIVDEVTALTNYYHNLSQTFDVDASDVAKGYINYQEQFTTWRYGLTTMNNNGCGAIATYNVLKHVGKFSNTSIKVGNTKALATIVRDYEAFHGTIAFAFGGTNPAKVESYLWLRGVKVVTYSGISDEMSFYTASKSLKPNQIMMLDYWWQLDGEVGAHLVAIIKDSSGNFIIPNGGNGSLKSLFDYIYAPNKETRGFIKGWIIG